MMKKVLAILKKNTASIAAGLVCLAILVAILVIPNSKNNTQSTELSNYSSVSAICELATLRCYYHDVAIYEEKSDGSIVTEILTWPFNTWLNLGYKRSWQEYSGIVEIGIKANQVQVNKPNAQGVVEVYIPDAEVLSIDAVLDTLSDPIEETGKLTRSVSSEERAEAYAASQNNMKEEAENDRVLLQRAKNNAKLILERYIINIGKGMGKDYTVKWIDNPR